MITPISDNWDLFEAERQHPQVSIGDARLAFFAGASAALAAIVGILEGEPDEASLHARLNELVADANRLLDEG